MKILESKNTYRNNKQETETTTEDFLKAMATTTTKEDEGKRKTNLPNKFGADKGKIHWKKSSDLLVT